MLLLDATLREGEQRGGQTYSVEQKRRVVEHLDALGMDYVQVGFPVRADGTKEVCAGVDVETKLAGIARAIEGDIDAAATAGVDVIEVFVPTSDKQRESVLGASRADVLDMTVDAYEYAHTRGFDEVHVLAMDGFRTEPAFLDDVFTAVDAPIVGINDTVGGQTPSEVTAFLDALTIDLDRVSVHFHQDLGLATANVLAAAECGAGKADVTIGGIGERAGNAPLEELIVSGTIARPTIDSNIDTDALIPTCHAVLDVLDEPISPHKPILGQTAFEHESGLHTAAMLDDPSVFEPFDPAHFGGTRTLLFGPASGRGAARRLLERTGITDPTDDQVTRLLETLHARDDHIPLDDALALAADTES